MKRLFSCICLIVPLILSAQVSTTPLDKELPAGAMEYSLPQTILKVKVRTKTITETPGKYARYAERYLGISEVIIDEKITHEIVSVDVSHYTMPDPQQKFYIQTVGTNDKETTTPLNVWLTPLGILHSINLTPCPKIDPRDNTMDKSEVKLPKQKSQENLIQQTAIHTQEMQLASSSIREAELASKQIFALRETRIALIQGEMDNMPTDGEALSLFMKGLDQMEQRYTSLFTGYRKEEISTQYFDITPSVTPCYEVLFRFSIQKGIVDKNDLSGTPIHFLIYNRESEEVTQSVDSVSIVVAEKSSSRKKSNDQPVIKQPKTVALYYYHPYLSEISLLNGQQTLYRNKLYIAQFGDLMKLTTDTPLRVELNPETGGLIRREF